MNAISLFRRALSFPLLAKELTETAARRRTYVIRVVYGVLLFAVIALWMPQSFWGTSGDFADLVMGAGEDIFGKILALEFIGLGLFLPALMAGSITHEKERDSLVLLLLTDLRPGSIILQKFVGGLAPVLSFLLLAMPLTAIAYAFGGISATDLVVASVALLLTALQIGALSLMLSAWCRTTVGAFIGTYFGTAMLYAGPPLLLVLSESLSARTHVPSDERIAFLLMPAHILGIVQRGGDVHREAGFLLVKGIVDGISIVLFLGLARFFLVRRAFLSSSSVFLRLFRVLDRTMRWANRFAGNIVLARDVRSLPGDEPVAWREITRKALGKTHYLFRILVAVEIPVILFCGSAAILNSINSECESLPILAAIVGAFGVLALGAQAANVIVSERVQQTLEVLLTTPITGREIVRQKAKALRRVAMILAIPLLTIFGTECWIEHNFSKEWREGIWLGDSGLMYAVCALLSIAIFLPLVSWLALWIGLKTRTRFKAILAALAVIVAWCAVPLVAAGFIRSHSAWTSGGSMKMICLLSPLTIAAANEDAELQDSALSIFPPPEVIRIKTWTIGEFVTDLRAARSVAPSAWIVVFLTFSFYGILLWLVRRLALRRADYYLRR